MILLGKRISNPEFRGGRLPRFDRSAIIRLVALLSEQLFFQQLDRVRVSVVFLADPVPSSPLRIPALTS